MAVFEERFSEVAADELIPTHHEHVHIHTLAETNGRHLAVESSEITSERAPGGILCGTGYNVVHPLNDLGHRRHAQTNAVREYVSSVSTSSVTSPLLWFPSVTSSLFWFRSDQVSSVLPCRLSVGRVPFEAMREYVSFVFDCGETDRSYGHLTPRSDEAARE